MCKTKQAQFEQKYNNYTNTIPWLEPTFTGCRFIADIKTTEDPFVKTNPCPREPGRGDNSTRGVHGQVEWNYNDPCLAAFQKFSIPQAQSP